MKIDVVSYKVSEHKHVLMKIIVFDGFIMNLYMQIKVVLKL